MIITHGSNFKLIFIIPYRFLKFSLFLGYFASLMFNKCFNSHSIWELSNSARTPAYPTHPHPPKIFFSLPPTTQNNSPPTQNNAQYIPNHPQPLKIMLH